MKRSVLVIGASKVEKKHLQGLLEKYGFDVELCDDTASAVLLVRKNNYDIIFLDYMAKRYDGGKKLMELDTPVVVIGECDDHMSIEKPVSPMKLRALIESLSEYDIKGIDRKTGINNCGSEEGYLSALEIFYCSLDSKADEIERYYNEHDLENYTIKVHALKSSSKLVGALALSDMAKELEYAGKKGDKAFVEEKTERLLKDYREFKTLLSPIFEKELPDENDDREYIAEDDYNETIKAIGEFADVMDYDSVEMMLDTFKEFRLKKEDAVIVRKIESFLMELKWEEIKEICKI